MRFSIFISTVYLLLNFAPSAFADKDAHVYTIPPAHVSETPDAKAPDAKASEAPVTSEETGGALRFRSNPDKYLWVYGFGGLQAGWWGVNSGGGVGGRHGVGARAMFGRCGGVFEWNTEHMDYYHPDPTSDMRVIGAGATCRFNVMEKKKFWRGAHFVSRIMAEYATNDYEILGYLNRFVAAGRTYGGGGVAGVDFHFPIFFGFWTFLGSGVEVLQFKYNIPDNADSIRDGGGPTWNFFIRAGLAYAPF